MVKSQQRTIVNLDGRTGEGGGQVVRVAVCLAALTGTPLRIEHVRGNRPGKRAGGLKAQHLAGIECLAAFTDAETQNCFIGSHSFEFQAKHSPLKLKNRNIQIKADSAASVLLVFQTVLPFLVFATDGKDSPVTVTIQGGTNVSFSLSFEFLDQVLLPALERFGLKIERKLEMRGWSHGSRQIGSIRFKFIPLRAGKCLRTPSWPKEQGTVAHIDASLVVPMHLQQCLKKALLIQLGLVFPGVDIVFKVIEDSRHAARMYTLLVAHTSTGLQFGRDWLYDERSKDKSTNELSARIADKVVHELDEELRKGGVVDEHLQDQLIIFQALAEGRSSIPGSMEALSSDRERVDRADQPFGDGSTHTKTARWVTSQLFPKVIWIDQGRICEGVAWRTSAEEGERLL